MDTKLCKCGATITRAPRTGDQAWENREYCNQSCVNKYRPRGAKVSHVKVCANPECGKEFETDKKAQGSCSVSCAARLKNSNRTQGGFRVQIPDKECVLESCGKTYSRKPGEPAHRFRERKYCSRPCTLQAMSERAHGPLDSGRTEGKKGNVKRMILPAFPTVSSSEPWRPPAPRPHPGRSGISDHTVVQVSTQQERTLRRARFAEAYAL